MFCKSCGQKLGDNAKFCGHCGALVIMPNQPTVQKEETHFSPSPILPQEPAKKEVSGGKAALIIGIVIFIGIIIVAVVANNHQQQNTDTSNNTNNTSATGMTDSEAEKFFRATEIVSNQLPDSVSFWTEAFCPNAGTQWDYTVPAGYSLTSCQTGDKGVHGGCPSCIMSQITLMSGSDTQESQPVQNNPQPQQQSPPTSQSQKSLPDIISEWSNNVALVLCNFADGSADFGSGFLTHYPSGEVIVVTNKHVINNEATGYAATTCAVEIPGDGSNYYTVSGDSTRISNSGYDWGYIPITNGDTYFNKVAANNLPICGNQEQTGDSIVILGYPDYAGQFTNPTATQGIISGYAAPYYTTSAQIESGNSGGVAVDTNKDCYVGIPSAVKTGNYANLGRILSADIPFQLSY